MPKLFVALAAALAVAAVPMSADAAPCKDAKGKFIKCPPAPVAKPAVAKVETKKVTATKVTKTTVKKAPCRDAKGRFTKCK